MFKSHIPRIIITIPDGSTAAKHDFRGCQPEARVNSSCNNVDT